MDQQPLSQNLWERYGFTDNPYDTKALSISKAATLSVQQAYVERDSPSIASQVLTNFLRSPGGGRIIVEGDPGVGKTTFVNYHRQRWETAAKQKLLSPATEISVREGWTERDFLLNLIASLSARLRLDLSAKEFEKDKLLREITAITGVRMEEGGGFTGSVTILGVGGGIGHTKTASVKVGEVTNDQLRDYLRGLVERVRSRGFVGVIFHMDNLDLLARHGPDKLRGFFEAVRDVLQEPNVYYIFVGYKGLFQQIIVPQPRVRSIFFDTPVHLEPLLPAQVQQAMQKRYELLAVPKKSWIKPVEDDVILHLYQTFSGKIRYVMNAVTSLISHLPDSYARPLSLAEATTVLRQILHSEVRNALSEAAAEVFLVAVNQGRFTNVSVGKEAKKSKQQIQKYLSHWRELGFVFHTEKTGRNQFYEVEPRFSVLRKSRAATTHSP
jgi:Cdc6-like AAA superfamily ATPase